MANDVRVRSTFVDKISGPISRIQDKFDHLGKGGTFKSLTQGVGMGAGIAAFNLLGDAASRAVGFIGDSVGAASDQREAMALNEQVFKGASKAIDDWSDTTAEAFGESKTNAINYAAAFGNVMKAAGLSADELAEKSMELTRRAADIGSAFNRSGDEVSTALRAGLVGETEPLRRLGILMNAAEVENRALAMGLAKTKKEITEADKVLARYNIIMEQSAESAGMFGRDTESLADAQKALDAALSDVQAEIGTQLMPAMLALATFTKDEVVPVISGLVDVMDDAGDAFNVLGEVINAVTSQGTSGITAWGRHIERESEAAADAVSESTSFMASAVKDDLQTAGRAVDRTGGKFEDLADAAKKETRAVKLSFEWMVDALSAEADKLITDFFDPIEARAEIWQERQEQNAAEERLRDAETATEKREATSDILSSMRRQAEGLVSLSDQGQLTKKDIDRFETDVKQSYKALGKQVPAEIQKIIDKLRELDKWDGHRIRVNVGLTPSGAKSTGGPGRAAGGPIEANKVYRVGEHGPEDIVSSGSGRVIPNHQLGGGGNTTNFFLTFTGSIGQSKDNIVDQVHRLRRYG